MRPTHSKFLALGATASAVALLAGACCSGGSSAGGSDAPCILTTQPARALSAGNCEAVFAQSAADEAWARLLGRDDHVTVVADATATRVSGLPQGFDYARGCGAGIARPTPFLYRSGGTVATIVVATASA